MPTVVWCTIFLKTSRVRAARSAGTPGAARAARAARISATSPRGRLGRVGTGAPAAGGKRAMGCWEREEREGSGAASAPMGVSAERG